MPEGNKTEKATPKKRRDQRKKGNVFLSNDAVAVVTLLAGYMGLSMDKYHEDAAATALCNIVSLEAIFERRGEGDTGVSLAAEEADLPEASVQQKEMREQLGAGIRTLRENEQLVLSLYYERGLNMKKDRNKNKYIVRQPIRNAQKQTIGYEILYYGENQAFGGLLNDREFAAADTVYNFLIQNTDKILKGSFYFMTFTATLLLKKTPDLFDRSELVIQIDDSVMTLTYGSSRTIDLSFDDLETYDTAEDFAAAINSKLASTTVINSSGESVAASTMVKATLDNGTVTFTDNQNAGNTVTITDATGKLKDTLGIDPSAKASSFTMFVNIMHRRVVTLVDGRVAGDVAGGRYGEIKERKSKFTLDH